MLTGCSSLEGSGQKGYVSGDGSVIQYDAADRGEPIEFSGQTLDGEPFDIAELRGKVAVVNVWWSGCGPCVLEAPMLEGAAAETAAQASFIGINTRDNGVDLAADFERKYDITYPSIYDPSAESLLAFSGTANMRGVPSTVVLDRQGRVAAAISGPIPTQLTLTDLIEQVAAEDD